jgi:hypothetical protein
MKSFFKFPYRGKKYNYYFGKIFCGCVILCGVDLYSRYLWKQSYRTTKQITEKNSKELESLVDLSKNKRKWYFKGLFTSVLLLMPGFYGLYKYEYLPKKYIIYTLAGVSIFVANGVYNILAHTYNSIRFGEKINVVNYNTKIAHVKAVTQELNGSEPDQNILNNINEMKISWFMINYQNNDSISYIIRNKYYEKLFFIFDVEIVANDFMIELNKLDTNEVDFLSNNLEEANQMRNEFVKNKTYSAMIYRYYNTFNK